MQQRDIAESRRIVRLRLARARTQPGECTEDQRLEELPALHLLVDRRGGIEKQSDEILDLLLGEGARVSEPRHLRAQVVRLGVVDLAVDVFLDLRAAAAHFAEIAQARADGAERRFLRRELMAVVAAAVVGAGRLVAPSEAAAALRDALAALPVADAVAGGGGGGRYLVWLAGPVG